MWLITPSLLNSFAYYYGYAPELTIADEESGVALADKEAEARADFMRALSREKTPPNENMQKGIGFENRVYTHCGGQPDESQIVQDIGVIVAGGMWQVAMKREFGEFLLYARADVVKCDTIYDIKRTSSYDVGKYQPSAQHRIEFLCSGMPKFSYLVSDERYWWREDYFNHAGIEQEVNEMIRRFTGYLEGDAEAKALYYGKWQSLGAQAA